MAQPDDIKGWTAIGIAVMGIIFSAGAWIQKVRSHGKLIKELQDAVRAIPEDVRRRLYNADSQPIYVPVTSCEKMQGACSKRFEAKIDKLDEKLDKLIQFHLDKKQ